MGEVGSVGQYLLCVMEEKGCYMDKQVFYADETSLFLQGHWQMNLCNSVVSKPLTLNCLETLKPCYCLPLSRVILSPNPLWCTESSIHEHLKVGQKKHEWCLKYCLGVWDWFHNCFILEVDHL